MSEVISENLVRRVDELGALYELTDRLYRARSLADVYEAALDAIVQTLGCSRASILVFDQAGVMRFVAWRGLSEGYRSALEGHSPWKPGERDPDPIFVDDIDRTDEADWVKATIRQERIRGLGFIPLMAHGEVVGKFMTYFAKPHVFAAHEIELAVTIARQVGFSLERMRADEARRDAEERLRVSEDRFREMLENAPVMIWQSHADGHCAHLNRMLRTFWGVSEEDIAAFDFLSMAHPDDMAEIGRIMGEAIASRTKVTLKTRFRNAAGEYRILHTDAQPDYSGAGEFRGMIGVNVDITEREEAEEALRASEERFRLGVEAAPSGMVMTDGSGRIVLVNAQAERLLGYGRDELVGQRIEILVPERFRRGHPDYRAGYNLGPEARPMGANRELWALRKDGGELPVEIGLSPFETSEGPMTLAAIVDISERKRSEAQRELLIGELNHRVKNTLAVVQALAHQSFREVPSSAPARASFEGRLRALAEAHNLLTEANWENASLTRIVEDVTRAQCSEPGRIRLDGPEVMLTPKAALALAMGLHELCTNAIKYGALSNESGKVSVLWNVPGERRIVLTWTETGGPPVAPPARRGFGTRLIERMLADDLDGEVKLDFQPEGLVCRIDAPL